MASLRDALAAAVGHHRAGRLADAEGLYHSILRARPDHADAQHLLGVLDSQRGRPAAGAARLRRALALAPADGDFLNDLALALRACGDADGAARAFARALVGDPGLAEAAYNLGNLRLAAGDPAAAAACYRHALDRRSAYPDAWNNLGTALLALGRAADAAVCFANTATLAPERPDARINRANAEAALGRTGAAGRLYGQALALAPGDADAWYNAAVFALSGAGMDAPVVAGRPLDREGTARGLAGLRRVRRLDAGHAAAGDALIGATLKLLQAGLADDGLVTAAARAAPAALRRDPRDTRAAAAIAYHLYRRGRSDLGARFMGRIARRFTPAEAMEDFELRTWSMVRAGRGFVAGLPAAAALADRFAAVERVFEPPGGDGPLLFVACDDGYYRRFVGPLLESVAARGGPAVQVHVIDPSPDTDADLDARRQRMALGYSRERVDFTGWDRHRRTTYYACIRFLRLYQLLRHSGRPVVQVDADCTVEGDLGALATALDGHDVGLLRDGRRRGPTREIVVCFVWVQPTPAGEAWLERTAAYVGHFLAQGRGYWMLDQAAPFCVLEATAPVVRWFDWLDFPWVRFIGEK
ncbi:tetratricopeptide repeat protein [Azospirillum halopraeferens]|uniref:tetratricopeptide repeat protein n=1 Tax=Azospirillum halopraeferens TaxID=34010 RepID=UPI0003FC097C|nr:tetratricopeptide repeat protein [Azospirillum halopraeferens]